jgi:predicted enzyme related to lactoylglutathione lyase
MYRPLFFQLPASDPGRLAEFYSKVFGWGRGKMAGLGEIWALVSGPFDQPGMNGIVMGKFMEGTVNAIEVPDLDAALLKVEEQGGRITTPKQNLPTLGDFAWCRDTDGNYFVLMQLDVRFVPSFLAAVGNAAPETGSVNRPVHFELPSADPERLGGFYAAVLGWTMQKWQGEMDYYFLMTGDPESGGIDGAISPGDDLPYPVNVISVSDAEAMVARVMDAGGTVPEPPHMIEGVGLFTYAFDPEGNQFGLMQFNA